MKHVMIDIETMASSTDAAVLSIGLCEFDPASGTITERAQEYRCTFEAMEKLGRRFAPDTMEWWLKQGKAAQTRLLEAPRFSDARALVAATNEFLYNTAARAGDLALWAKDPTFDIMIMRSLCSDLDMTWHGKFYREYSVRTMLMIAQANGWDDILAMSADVEHGALSDAIHQAEQVMAVMQRMKN